jgi:hypothetical protein
LWTDGSKFPLIKIFPRNRAKPASLRRLRLRVIETVVIVAALNFPPFGFGGDPVPHHTSVEEFESKYDVNSRSVIQLPVVSFPKSASCRTAMTVQR